jgi:peptidoglycan-associated lipoprotein
MRHTWGMVGAVVLAALVVVSAGACHKKVPSIENPAPPPAAASPEPTLVTPARPPAPPAHAKETVKEPAMAAPAPIVEDRISSASLDEINKNSPLKPVFFNFDQSEISPESQKALEANADVLKRNPAWVVTIEGHCDERGTAEYNLALGERRAGSARAYLVSLGIPADRLRTVSYGKEFPFDPGHDEAAWAKNRRAHFVVTQK